MTDAETKLAGELVLLLPERAMYWPAKGTLFVADTHWGKAATLRAHSIPIPQGTTAGDLSRLTQALKRMDASRLVLLGDAIHARQGRSKETFAAITSWRTCHPNLEILLVRGNHDRGAGDPPAELEIRCVNAPEIEPPFAFQHHPTRHPGAYALAGHVHPAVRLRGLGAQRATLRCFHVTTHVTTLPAFGDMCGRGIIERAPEDRVFAIADDEVLEV